MRVKVTFLGGPEFQYFKVKNPKMLSSKNFILAHPKKYLKNKLATIFMESGKSIFANEVVEKFPKLTGGKIIRGLKVEIAK
jgi:hypothetical protein